MIRLFHVYYREMASAEIPRSPENLNRTAEMIGLQGRLVLANQLYLDSTKELSEGNLQITSFAERDYSLFDKTANRDRKSYWSQAAPEQSLDERKITWSLDLANKLNNRSQDTMTTYFTHIGIDLTEPDAKFTAEHAERLFDRYFSQPPEGKGIKKFVEDILASSQTNGRVNARQIENNLVEIRRLANMFGEGSDEIVTQLVLAETSLITEPDAFRAKITASTTTPSGKRVMRINNLGDDERRILGHLERPPEQQDMRPILRYKEEIQRQALNNDSVIILGGTGSGKTTGTPVMIREIMKPGEKLIVTEPRQINTEELAGTIAAHVGATLGKEVGFQHGDKKKFSQQETDTLFMTEQILAMKLLSGDPSLNDLSYVMVDEVHVQNTYTDVLLGLLKKEQERRKTATPPLSPLKIIAVSATADKEKLQQYFNNNSPIEVEGRMHPVDVNFSEIPLGSKQLPEAAANKAMEILQGEDSQEGDIVITVAGQGDMKKVQTMLAAKNLPPQVKVIPLHRGSKDEEKAEVGKKAAPGERRIIIATNFIETGVTIEGLKYLINSGEKFENNIDPRSGLTYVAKTLQSQAECKQWEGRVGRVSPGTVYHLFTQDEYHNRPKYPLAEMERSDLTDVVLLMKDKGHDIKDYQMLSTVTTEQQEAFAARVAFSEETLQKLGAMTPEGELTEIGTEMQKMIEDYRVSINVARMLVEAKQNRQGFLDIYTIATLMQERSLFTQRDARTQFNTEQSDFLTFLNIWKQFEENDNDLDEAWARQHGLNYAVLKTLQSKRDELPKRMRELPSATPEMIKQFVYNGYKDRLMRYHPPKRTYLWERTNAVSFTIRLDRDSASNTTPPPEYIIAADNSAIIEREQTHQAGPESIIEKQKFVYVSNCQKIDPAWV